jgi:hypothetical protein
MVFKLPAYWIRADDEAIVADGDGDLDEPAIEEDLVDGACVLHANLRIFCDRVEDALVVFNDVVIASASGFVTERIDASTELGQHVPPGLRLARDLLAATAPVLSSAALALLASAVLVLLAVKAEPGKRARAR